jgi:hypothetical protein
MQMQQERVFGGRGYPEGVGVGGTDAYRGYEEGILRT